MDKDHNFALRIQHCPRLLPSARQLRLTDQTFTKDDYQPLHLVSTTTCLDGALSLIPKRTFYKKFTRYTLQNGSTLNLSRDFELWSITPSFTLTDLCLVGLFFSSLSSVLSCVVTTDSLKCSAVRKCFDEKMMQKAAESLLFYISD